MKINQTGNWEIAKANSQVSLVENPFTSSSEPIVNYLGEKLSKEEIRDLSVLKNLSRKERLLWQRLSNQKKKKILERIARRSGFETTDTLQSRLQDVSQQISEQAANGQTANRITVGVVPGLQKSRLDNQPENYFGQEQKYETSPCSDIKSNMIKTGAAMRSAISAKDVRKIGRNQIKSIFQENGRAKLQRKRLTGSFQGEIKKMKGIKETMRTFQINEAERNQQSKGVQKLISQSAKIMKQILTLIAHLVGTTIYNVIIQILIILFPIILVVVILSGLISSVLSVFTNDTQYIANFGAMPYYNQGDYPNYPFNGKSIATSGCGITSMAMVVSLFTGAEHKPPELADIANTDSSYNTVISHGALAKYAAKYGLEKPEEMGGMMRNCCGKKPFSMEYLQKKIEEGCPVIISNTGGKYNPSGSGHYILLYGAGSGGVLVYDSGSRARTNESQKNNGADWNSVLRNSKHIWIFQPMRNTENVGAQITVPESYNGHALGDVFTIEHIPRGYWSSHPEIPQGAVQKQWSDSGRMFDQGGLAKIGEYYLVACTKKFGMPGEHTTFYFNDKTKIECLIIDTKAETYEYYDHNPANEWGHQDGHCILEFAARRGSSNPGTLLNHPEWRGKRIIGAIRHGKGIQ